MYELELSFDDDFELYSEFPSFKNPLKHKRFWIHKTVYNGKISYIITDMLEKRRYLFYDDNSVLGTVFVLERGESFDCEYVADFDDWNDFYKEFSDLQRMTNLVIITLQSLDEDEL